MFRILTIFLSLLPYPPLVLYDGRGFSEVEEIMSLLLRLPIAAIFALDHRCAAMPLLHLLSLHDPSHDRLQLHDACFHLAIARAMDERAGILLREGEISEVIKGTARFIV